MKLFVDGVEIPWPKKIEVQVDEAGETVGPVLVQIVGGQLVIEGTLQQREALRIEGHLKHPLVLRLYQALLVPVEERGSRGEVLFDEDKLSNVKLDGRVRTVTGYDARTKTVTLADPVEDLPTPHVVTGG